MQYYMLSIILVPGFYPLNIAMTQFLDGFCLNFLKKI